MKLIFRTRFEAESNGLFRSNVNVEFNNLALKCCQGETEMCLNAERYNVTPRGSWGEETADRLQSSD